MSDTLERICRDKRAHVSERKAAMPLAAVEEAARTASPPRGFLAALARAVVDGYGLISEIKRASPSRGLSRAGFDPPQLAARVELPSGDFFPYSLDNAPILKALKTAFA